MDTTLNNRDLDWLGERFIDVELPKEKEFLRKYFKTKIQSAFLAYYITFGNYDFFVDHTGICAHYTVLHRMRSRYHWLLEQYEYFKQNMCLTELALLNSGKYKVPRKYM